jgi:2-amino-4-hydroxy-6-hydroxymethyldihydropteridine diphosphokinase
VNKVHLILGGNKGDRLLNINNALLLIEEKIGVIINRSKIYQTQAWGNINQPDFLNQAICIQTKLAPQKLLKELIKIEELLGRVRTEERWMERTMDIDILFYNDEIIDTSDLKIPHPYIKERKFVLVPLHEIASDLIHPIHNVTISSLLSDCSDTLNVFNY